jgi:hypothetical protein
MPLFAARTRYSLVKGERIVRFVLTARLRDLQEQLASFLYRLYCRVSIASFSVGLVMKTEKREHVS